MQINSRLTHMQSIIVLPINTYFPQNLSKVLITKITNSSFPKSCIIIGSNILVKMFLQKCLKVPCILAVPWVVVTLGLSTDVWLSLPAPAPLGRWGESQLGTPHRPGGCSGKGKNPILSEPFKLECCGLSSFVHLFSEMSSTVIA